MTKGFEIKSYEGKISTSFHSDNALKKVLNAFGYILIDSAFETGKNCYSVAILEECKYFVKEKRIHKYIIDNLGISSDDENSDEENSDEEKYSEKKL